MRILAVDDEPVFLDILKPALEQLGYDDVTLVHSAAKAKEAIQGAQWPFDCLLVDIRMPGTDGIELAAWVRDRPEYRQTPIPMVTQMTGQHHVDSAFAAVDPPDLLPMAQIGTPVASHSRFPGRGTDSVERLIADITTRQKAAAAKTWTAA